MTSDPSTSLGACRLHLQRIQLDGLVSAMPKACRAAFVMAALSKLEPAWLLHVYKLTGVKIIAWFACSPAALQLSAGVYDQTYSTKFAFCAPGTKTRGSSQFLLTRGL